MSAKSEEMSAQKGPILAVGVADFCHSVLRNVRLRPFLQRLLSAAPVAAPFAGLYLLLFLGVRDTPQKGLLGLTRLISEVGILISFFLFALTQMGGPFFKLALPLFFSQWVVEVSAGKTTPR
jgi:hypothetical protein